MKMQESGENYLETILILQNQKGFVRSIDIAKELNYTKASISRAMSIIEKGRIYYGGRKWPDIVDRKGIAKGQ